MKLSELIEEEFINNWIDHENHDTPAAVDDITTRLHECVKPLEWVRVVVDGSGDIQAQSPFGFYVISQDSVFAGSTCYLWNAGSLGENDREFLDMTTAKVAAQSHYAKRITEGLNL